MTEPDAPIEQGACGALVVGAGYVGSALAAHLVAAGRVLVTARSAERCEALKRLIPGIEAVQFDTACDAMPEVPSGAFDVYCLLTPSALATPAARECLLRWLAKLNVRMVLMTSSTAVYGEAHGSVVNAASLCVTTEERAQRLWQIEQTWLSRPGARIVRLAGLYGPHRVIGQTSVMSGTVLSGQSNAYLNLLHRDDAVDLLIRCARTPSFATIEVGSDGVPITRGAYYSHLAEVLGAPAPRFAESPSDVPQGKRVDPSDTFARLNWQPRYRDFRQGLAQALNPIAR